MHAAQKPSEQIAELCLNHHTKVNQIKAVDNHNKGFRCCKRKNQKKIEIEKKTGTFNPYCPEKLFWHKNRQFCYFGKEKQRERSICATTTSVASFWGKGPKMMQSGTFCKQKKTILQFLEENGSKVCKMSSCGEEMPAKIGKWRRNGAYCKICVALANEQQSKTIEENRGESRRIEENRGESRRIEENRGESRKIEENRGESRRIEENRGKSRRTRKWRGNGREKRQRGKKKAVFDILAGFAKFVIHFHSVITCFANFRPSPKFSAVFLLFSTFSPNFCVVSLCQRFFIFFPSCSANFCCFAPVFHPFSAEFSRSQMFLKRPPSFRPVFPIFHPISPKNKRGVCRRKKTRKQYFQEIVPGFSGDFVYVLFHPQNERTPRTRKHIFATHPIRWQSPKVVDVYVFFLRLGVLMYYTIGIVKCHTGYVDQDVSSEEIDQNVTRDIAHGQSTY